MKCNRDFRGVKDVFTLIELLIVIAIIAILASLLLPSLGKAKNSAKRINCTGNIRQCTLAVMQYSNDFNGWTMAMRTTDSNPWSNEFVTVNDSDEYWGYLINALKYLPNDAKAKVLVCPSIMNDGTSKKSYTYAMRGGADMSLSKADRARYYKVGQRITPHKITNSNDAPTTTPSMTLLFFDSINPLLPKMPMDGGANNDQFCLPHNRVGNISFFDGHVSSTFMRCGYLYRGRDLSGVFFHFNPLPVGY